MSLHRAVVSHSDSWDMDFYLLVVSGVSSRYGDETKRNLDGGVGKRVRCVRGSPTRIKPGDLAYENHPTLKYLTRTQTRN